VRQLSPVTSHRGTVHSDTRTYDISRNLTSNSGTRMTTTDERHVLKIWRE
jgi:hypothetical protein